MCFKEVLRVFQGSFKDISIKFQKFHISFKDVSRKGASRVWKWSQN